jgi:hypothetical protein
MEHSVPCYDLFEIIARGSGQFPLGQVQLLCDVLIEKFGVACATSVSKLPKVECSVHSAGKGTIIFRRARLTLTLPDGYCSPLLSRIHAISTR